MIILCKIVLFLVRFIIFPIGLIIAAPFLFIGMGITHLLTMTESFLELKIIELQFKYTLKEKSND